MNSLSMNEKIGVTAGIVVVAGIIGTAWVLGAQPTTQQTAGANASNVDIKEIPLDATTTPINVTPPIMPSADLKIQDTQVGTGAEATVGDTVKVLYTGTLPDGTVFDSTSNRNNEPFSFTLGQGRVIAGWEQGVTGMKVGGKRRLVIPPKLGYGERGFPPVIPSNATLTFDIELLGIEK